MRYSLRAIALSLFAVLCASLCMGQTAFFNIDLDDQDPGNRDISIESIYEGNNLWAKSRHFSNGEPSDMEDDWSMVFELRYSQFNTNGAVQFPGTWDSSNTCHYLNLTNMVPPARTWFCEIVGTHTAGYVKTFMQGTCEIEYSPGSDTNMTALLGQWNATWWTNNVGAQVSSNTARIVVLEASTNLWNQGATDATYSTNWISTNTLPAQVTAIEGRTGTWNTASTDASFATNWISTNTLPAQVTALKGQTSTWNTAATDATAYTNWASTNTLQAQITSNDTDIASNAADIAALDLADYLLTNGTRNTAYLLAGDTATVAASSATAASTWTFGGFASWATDLIKVDIGKSGTVATNWYGSIGSLYKIEFASSVETDQSVTVALGGNTHTWSTLAAENSAYMPVIATNTLLMTGVAGSASFLWVSNLTVSAVSSGHVAAAEYMSAPTAYFNQVNIGSDTVYNVIVTGTGNATVTPTTNGNVVTYAVAAGSGTFTNANIEGTSYSNSFILYAGTSVTIRTEGGTNFIDAAGGGGGVTDHGALTGLGDDDHALYLTAAEGDAAYAPITTTPVDSRDATNDIEMAAYNVQWTEVVELTAAVAGGNVSTNDGQITGYASLAPSTVENLLDGEIDSTATTNYYRTSGGSTGDWWFQYDFGSGSNTVVTKYILTGWEGNVAMNMDDWDFKGSTNGTSWVNLDSQTNRSVELEESTYPNPGIITQTFANAVAYRYYVFTNIYNSAANDRVHVGEVELHGDGTAATYATNTYYAVSGKVTRYASNQTLTTADYHVFMDTDAGPLTNTLPAGVTGADFRIVNTGTSGNNLTIVPNGAELLVGANSNFTLRDGEALLIVYEATEGWF